MTTNIEPGSPTVLRAFAVAAALLLLHTSLRGIDYPHIWAATHSLFSYEFGFSKRSLLGGIYEFIGCNSCYHYKFFFYTSNLLYAANLFLMWLLACDVIKSRNLTAQLLTLAFCASAGIVYLATTIGWGDHAGLFCVLLALRIRDFYLRSSFIFLSLAVVLLVHEGNYVLFLPVAIASLLADVEGRQAKLRLGIVAGIGILLTILVLIIGNSAITSAEVEQLTILMQEKADFPIIEDAAKILSADVGKDAAIMLRFLAAPPVQKGILSSLLASAPLVVALTVCTFALNRSRRILLASRILIPLSALSPYFLYPLGYDLNRWNAMACITAFIAFSLSIKNLDGRSTFASNAPAQKLLSAIAACLIILNLLVSAPLRHADTDKNPPYAALVAFINEWPLSNPAFPEAPLDRK